MGLAFVAVTIGCLQVAAKVAPGSVKDPGGDLWLVVLMITYLSGMRAGMIGSLMSLAYISVTYSQPGALFTYDHAMASKIWGSVVVFPLFVWIIGSIQNRMRNAAIREFDATQSASAAAEVQRRTERILKSSQDMWGLVFDSVVDGVIATQEDGTITLWNSGAERLFGYTREEAIGQPFSIVVPEDRLGEDAEIESRIALGEATPNFETVRKSKDGLAIAVSVSISVIRDADGHVTGFSKVIRDIRERKLGEQRLQAQLSRLNLLQQITRAIGERQDLRSIFQVVIHTLEDHLPIDLCCVCLYDASEGRLTVSAVGRQSAELAARLAMTEQSEISIDQNGLSQCVRGALVYEPDVREVPFPFPTHLAKGGLRSLVAAPLQVESQVFGVLIAARYEANGFSSSDCEFLKQLSEHVALASHQAQLYTALQEAYDDLRQTQQAIMQQERLRALGQMASGIAHDINNAISPVALYTEALLETEPNLSSRARGYLEITARAIEDVAATVARMREFYREREPQSLLSAVDMNQMIEEVVNLTRARWSDILLRQGVVIDLQQDLDEELPPIMGIESEIREVLTNLILNAVDAMPEGGKLTLRTSVSPECASKVVVEVSDTGVGMDENTQRRCLEPFFTTKGERGTGLGLAMVYGVVQRHGADIRIDSVPGQGTTMRMTFAASKTGAANGLEQEAASSLATTRILVVDDDPLILKSLRDALEGDGHDVATANGGQAGIDAVKRAALDGNAFPIVITDLGMPSVDGRQVARVVKQEAPSTLVIMLTGWGQRLIAEGDIPPHVDRVLSKPPKLRDLRAALVPDLAEAA
ncbi:MAG TPA: PAS domain S-box protein [Fimbriimonas sp.]|nr:PAS domain S-box protein [Fimbriimonas sp.]